MNILISAYACSPYQGSEAGVGWGFICELAKRHTLWVIVEEEKFRADIEHYLATQPDFPNIVKFIFLRKRRNKLFRKLWPPSYYWFYRDWHLQALNTARQLNAEVGFDLVHQLTMVGFREPGYLWKLGVPFVWGPIGGFGLFPWRFLPFLGLHSCLFYFAYNLINLWQMNFSMRPRLAARAAGEGLIAATKEAQSSIEHYWQYTSSVISEVGLPSLRMAAKSQTLRQPGEPLRILWTGLHIPRKALNLGLAALAQIKDKPWNLHILGNGPETASWKTLSGHLGISERCKFYGWLDRNSALKITASTHVMLITSLRDLTSSVIIEALALGLPVICLDHCGFSDVIDTSCGIKIPLTTPEDTISRLSNALNLLATDDLLRFRLSEGALIRAHDFAWSKKVDLLDRIYQRVIFEKTRS